jgi:hypothetical protein
VCLQQCPGRNSARWAPVKPWQVVPAVVSAGSFCPRLHGALCHVRCGGNGRVQLNGTAGTAELVYRGNLIRRDRTTAREGAWRAASARVQTPRAMGRAQGRRKASRMRGASKGSTAGHTAVLGSIGASQASKIARVAQQVPRRVGSSGGVQGQGTLYPAAVPGRLAWAPSSSAGL